MHIPTVTLIPGDGIGEEVIFAAKKILEAAGAQINWELCVAGAKAFEKGIVTGVPEETIQSIKQHKVAFKGPLETPVGFGEKSANVTLRKLFDTYGNIRPIKGIPGIEGPYAHYNVDMIVVRENVEDLYTGIEHMQTPEVAQALKLMSAAGCERIIRLAFALAESENRKKVTCATKANILKLTEGLMKHIFEDVSKDYPHIKAEHMIVDNCAHQMVMNPEQFDVVVMSNMNGDILSDLGSALVGGLGIAPGANYGNEAVIFEAVHGSAPAIAGQNRANPVAVLSSAIMMLRYLGQFSVANSIENALYVTISNGKHLTEDIARSTEVGSTTEFTDTIINNLGKTHLDWQEREYKTVCMPKQSDRVTATIQETVGVDVFIQDSRSAEALAQAIEESIAKTAFGLKMIAQCGMQVYPETGGVLSKNTFHHQCRFITKQGGKMHEEDVQILLKAVLEDYFWVHVERLQNINSKPGFTKLQGES